MDCLALQKKLSNHVFYGTHTHTHTLWHTEHMVWNSLAEQRSPGGAFSKILLLSARIIPGIETYSVLRQSKSRLSLLISAWALDVASLSVGRPSVSQCVVDSGWGQRYCPRPGSSSISESCSGVVGGWSDRQVVWDVLLSIYRSAYVPTMRLEPSVS